MHLHIVVCVIHIITLVVKSVIQFKDNAQSIKDDLAGAVFFKDFLIMWVRWENILLNLSSKISPL